MFCKHKLQSLIKLPVKYRQMQLVSLKPLTRRSEAQEVGWTGHWLARLSRAAKQLAEHGVTVSARNVADPRRALCRAVMLRATVQPHTLTPFYRSRYRVPGKGTAQVHMVQRFLHVPLTHSEACLGKLERQKTERGKGLGVP